MSKIKDLKQTTGQKEQQFKKTTISQVLGDTGLSVYKTLDLAVYEKELQTMSKYDMNVHAASLGIFPHDSVERLKRELVNEFRRHASMYKVPALPPVKQKPVSKELQAILSQAK